MGYERNQNRYGDWDDERFRRRGAQPQGMGYGERDYGRTRDHDRGFFERAGEEVRSWFSDDDHRRGGYDRERSQRDNRWRGDEDRDRGYYGSDFNRSDDEYAHGDAGQDNAFGAGRSGPADTWGGSGFGGPTGGRRFDRVDSGSTGTHGAHPMASPSGSAYGAGGGFGSSARSAAIMRQSGGGQPGRFSGQPYGAQQSQGHHDPHYSEWRNQQIAALDRDYDEYRREHQSKFEQDFGNWRNKRQDQRQSMGKVTEHMEVFGSDGEKIGTVDGVKGDRIILTKGDENAGGAHHSIPCSWIDSVDDKVTVNKTRDEAMNEWKNEERSRALFEREDQGSEGPHMLNRSFSGTY